MVRRKVRLRGHTVGDPPVVRIPSGRIVLGRISTSFSYREKRILIGRGGHHIYGSPSKFHTTGRGCPAVPTPIGHPPAT